MKNKILLLAAAVTLTGCGTEYTREIRAAESLENHRFTSIEFKQVGRRCPLKTYWQPESGFVLLADDGWRLVVHGPSTTGYNWSPDERRKDEPVYFGSGVAERLTLIDPEGGKHPVKVTIGELSPRPPHVTIIEQAPVTTQPSTTPVHTDVPSRVDDAGTF